MSLCQLSELKIRWCFTSCKQFILNLLSGLGNETSPELPDDDANLPTGNFLASASVDQSPCSSVLMRPLPQPSLSFCSPSCSFLRASMSSIHHHQPQQPDDDDVVGDCAAIYSTPSTCRASLRRMQPAPPPSDDTRVAMSSSNDDRSNAMESPSYKRTVSRSLTLIIDQVFGWDVYTLTLTSTFVPHK